LKWGRLAWIAKFLSDDPQSITAWKKGSSGEERVARQLKREVADIAVLLHDRQIPGSRANIDHLAIASSGVWIIDTKHYAGRVEHRDVGRMLKTDRRLYVGRRDRSKDADMSWQVDAVRKALTDQSVELHPTLCFVEADWGFSPKPITHKGVWVVWAKKLAEMIRDPGPLTPESVQAIARELAVALPSKK
jgi:hypothetical protein